MSNLTITPGSLFIGENVISGTSGSIPYINSSLALAQDNADIFWDAPNKRLGIGTSSPSSTIESMCTASTEIGLIVQAAASQSADLTRWEDSSGNSLLKVQSDGTVIYFGSAGTGNTAMFSSNSTQTLAGSSLIFFRSQNSIIYTSSPAFGLPPFFFYFNATVKATTNPITVSQPQVFNSSAAWTADGVVWTGSEAGATFADQPTFSIANGGSYTAQVYNAFRSTFTVNTGATIAQRTGFKFSEATGAGAVTTQIGLDIISLTKATTNIAIRTGAGGTIQFGNLITVYNNIATVSNGVPSELATVDLATQAAAIGATTIYTPAATGLFRVSIYLQVTRAATTSSILGGATGVVITYTDGDGSVAQSNTAALATTAGAIAVTAAGNSTVTNLEGSMIIYAKTGVAIQYAVGYTSVGVTTMQYAAHLKVEAL